MPNPDKKELDIIIPVFNEAENIINTLTSLQNHVKTSHNILICYDNDNDSTLAVLKRHPFNNIILVKNKGKGAHGAIMTGLYQATAPALLVYPADDDYNSSIVDAMHNKIKQGNELVAANRFIKGGSMKNCPWLKSVLVRAGSFSLYWFSFIPIKDASNGFRMFSKKLVDTVLIESDKGFTYSIEYLVKCQRLGWKIADVPAAWFERTKGQSRFRVLKWLPDYLRWYFYGLATTYLRKSPMSVIKRSRQ